MGRGRRGSGILASARHIRRDGLAPSGWHAEVWGDEAVGPPETRQGASSRGKRGMLTKEKAGEIFDRIRRFSSADEVEAIFTGSRFALTRFANNTIHQNVEEENSIVSIRTNFAGRTARSTANQFDDESLQRAVRASENLARMQAPARDLLPMPTMKEANSEGRDADKSVRATRFFNRTAAIMPDDRAVVVKGIVAVADQHKLTT